MKCADLLKLSFVVLCLCFNSLSRAEDNEPLNKTRLFQRLSNAGIDQIVELPYNRSLISQIGRQVKIHNILTMQDHPQELPEPTSLREEFSSSFNYHDERNVLPTLTYKVGNNQCAYMEAVKVSDILVCYRRASENVSILAPVSRYGPRCTTTTANLSHCFIFAHSVDDVVRAIASVD